MHKFILALLQDNFNHRDLYKALERKGDRNKQNDGGLGSAFKKATRHPLIDQALDIVDLTQSVTLKDRVALLALAAAFEEGKPELKDINKNSNKQAICLALTYHFTKDNLPRSEEEPDHAFSVLLTMEQLYRQVFNTQKAILDKITELKQDRIHLVMQLQAHINAQSTPEEKSMEEKKESKQPEIAEITSTPATADPSEIIIETSQPALTIDTTLETRDNLTPDHLEIATVSEEIGNDIIDQQLDEIEQNHQIYTSITIKTPRENHHSALEQAQAESHIRNIINEALDSIEEKPDAEKSQAASSPTSTPPTPDQVINHFLNQMRNVAKHRPELSLQKAAQKSYFSREIQKLSLAELEFLTTYMNDIQLGKKSDARFNIIRTESDIWRLHELGNTSVWREMRSKLKDQLLKKQQEQHAQSPAKIKISKEEYDKGLSLHNQHSSRYTLFYSLRKTKHARQYEDTFAPAEDSRQATPPSPKPS